MDLIGKEKALPPKHGHAEPQDQESAIQANHQRVQPTPEEEHPHTEPAATKNWPARPRTRATQSRGTEHPAHRITPENGRRHPQHNRNTNPGAASPNTKPSSPNQEKQGREAAGTPTPDEHPKHSHKPPPDQRPKHTPSSINTNFAPSTAHTSATTATRTAATTTTDDSDHQATQAPEPKTSSKHRLAR